MTKEPSTNPRPRTIDPTTQGLYARLCRVLDRQGELLTRLSEMSPRQQAAVEGEDPETLIQVLSLRQELIDELTGLEPEVATLRREWAQRADADDVQRRAVAERFDATALLAARVTSADTRYLEELKRQRERLAADLAAITRGQTATRAYEAKPTSPGARFQDHEI